MLESELIYFVKDARAVYRPKEKVVGYQPVDVDVIIEAGPFFQEQNGRYLVKTNKGHFDAEDLTIDKKHAESIINNREVEKLKDKRQKLSKEIERIDIKIARYGL